MRSLILFLSLSLIVTGCLNSIFTKYQDNQYVAPGKKFEQPVLQTLQMFIGESCAFIFIGINKFSETVDCNDYQQLSGTSRPNLPSSRNILLAIPAICDILGTTMMNLGLVYSPVSVYQMVRGALIIFVAAFSVFFLGKKISRVEYLALAIVIFGISLVGLSPKADGGLKETATETHPKVLLGVGLILLSQIFTAAQFVVEEHIISKWTIEPLKLVGYEGIFGAGATLLGMVVLYVLMGYKTDGPFDIVNSWDEFVSNSVIIYTSIAIMISIGLFNFIGITVTSKLSATSRSTIDTCRTLLVWLVSLSLGWESFMFLQLIGFAFLVFGTLIFNGAINVDNYLPKWFLNYEPTIRIIDTVDEQIERI